MNKNLFFAAVLLLSILILLSCKKTETAVTPDAAQTAPVNTTFFLNVGSTIAATGSGSFEYGTKFSVTKAGKITKLACKMPVSGTYRVTLWDATLPGTMLVQTGVVQSSNGLLSFATITPVPLTPGKDYLVSIWSSVQWYEVRPTGGATFAYPFSAGNISIKGYQWIGTPQSPQKFPVNAEKTYAAGLADFEYQAD